MSPAEHKYLVEVRADVAAKLVAKYHITQFDLARVARRLHLGKFSPNKFNVAIRRQVGLDFVEGSSTPREGKRDRAIIYVLCATNCTFAEGEIHTARGTDFAVELQEAWFADFKKKLDGWSEGATGVDFVAAELEAEVADVY